MWNIYWKKNRIEKKKKQRKKKKEKQTNEERLREKVGDAHHRHQMHK